MVDFGKLRTKKKKIKQLDPTEIFRRLPKPPGINDLYTSQAGVLQSWFETRSNQDVVLKLHTGGGKTLVGLLIAQSTLNETGEPVLYLSPTVQLVNQTLEKAKAHGISAVAYERGRPLNDDFVNGNAIMVATYKALFHGLSKFGIRGSGYPQKVAAIILDDAHAAFSTVRESFTLDILKNKGDRYECLTELFRKAFRDIDKLGSFDDIVSGAEYGVLEVPYWAWHEQLDTVREQIKSDADSYRLIWPLLRDNLHLCHALISKDTFTITPILPLVNAFPTFAEAPRRIYMSATIADDSEIIRTFDANPESVTEALTSRSLAGVSERMILIPDLMPFDFNVNEAIEKLIDWTSAKKKLGVVVLTPSDKIASDWNDVATVAKGSADVERIVEELQTGKTFGPAVFSNRYDGIDLPGDSCRLLIMHGLPAGTSTYELYRASALYNGATIIRMLAQRIEQGIGRGARGSGDNCVVILSGANLAAWIAKDANFRFLTIATRAQLEIGTEVSKEVKELKDLAKTIERSFSRDTDWTEYHAETLAELIDEESQGVQNYDQAATERKAINLWHDGYHEQAITKIEKFLTHDSTLDSQTRGWMEQLGARIADKWGNTERSEDLQKQAFAHNRNLIRPKILPPYRPLTVPNKQAQAIVKQIGGYRLRRGFLQSFEEIVVQLHANASSNRFEKALADLANVLGFSSERHDINGKGPDVLWLLPNKLGFVIEAKSRKKEKNALTKEEHGQLLVAAEWFAKNYKDYKCVRVSVHPKNIATEAAVAGASHALTYEKLTALVSDTRSVLKKLCSSQLSDEELERECNHILTSSPINSKKIVDSYFLPFMEVDLQKK
jgi:replicative superfamily II helicase